MNTRLDITAFSPAEPQAFRQRCPHFAFVLDLAQGRLANSINCEAAFRLMAAESLRGRPAFEGISRLLDTFSAEMASGDSRTDTRTRQAIGSWICEVMQANGFRRNWHRVAVNSAGHEDVVAECYERVCESGQIARNPDS